MTNRTIRTQHLLPHFFPLNNSQTVRSHPEFLCIESRHSVAKNFQFIKGNRNYFHAMPQRAFLDPLQKHIHFRGSRNQLAKPGRQTDLQIPFQIIPNVLIQGIYELQKMSNMQKAAIISTTFSTVIIWEKEYF